MASVPELRPGWLEGAGSPFARLFVEGAKANEGCRFFSRCAVARAGLCDVTVPPIRLGEGRKIACHHTIEHLSSPAELV